MPPLDGKPLLRLFEAVEDDAGLGITLVLGAAAPLTDPKGGQILAFDVIDPAVPAVSADDFA